jgi:hypothetical protein
MIFGTKSNLPLDTAPLVIIMLYLEFRFDLINFLKTFSSLSLKMPPSINLKNELLDKEFI